MAYSYTNYTGNGSTTQFSVPMPYIRKEHIHVYVNNVEVSFTWVNSTTVLLASAPANGAKVQVRRVTPILLPLVDYSDGSTFVAADLDTSNLQLLYIEQELDDSDKQAIYVDPATGQLTAGGQKIGNVGTPTVGTDAATKSYVDGADAAVVAAVATNAATAASSATSATAAKVAAEAARDQTLSAYDSFDDRYLGPKTSNPTLDNDGNTLVGGALYYNTVAQEMRLWTGSSWVTAYVSGNAAAVGFSPSGDIAAVNVQSAIQELDNEKMPKSGGAFTGDITLNAQCDLRLADSDSSNWVAFQAPATIASNITWTLPATDGTADQAFATNGSGTLSWVSFLKSSGGALTGDLTLNAQSDLRFADADSSNWVAFQAPATVASNVTWTLPATDGTSGQSLQTNGSGTLSWGTGGVTMTRTTAVNTTSGTSIDFTSIPSWVKRITIMFDAVSTNGTSYKQVQLGDSGGIETTGYNAGAVDLQNYYTITSGIPIGINYISSSTDAVYGQIILTNLTGNTWTCDGGIFQSGYNVACSIAGSKTLSATLDRVRLTTINGTDTFDAGTVNIIYEG